MPVYLGNHGLQLHRHAVQPLFASNAIGAFDVFSDMVLPPYRRLLSTARRLELRSPLVHPV